MTRRTQHVHTGVRIACCCSGGCASSFSVRVVCAMCDKPKALLALSSLAQELLWTAVGATPIYICVEGH